jgi:hypothetical protein
VKRRTAIAALSMAVLTAWTPAARSADPISVLQTVLEPSADGESWELSADFLLPLNATLEEAVNRGVVLHFVVEFELRRSRWYWWDEQVASATQTHRLSWHALTRQYRLLLNGVAESHGSLADALAALCRLRQWRVMPRERASAGQVYEARLRMRLDTDALPKSFQISALTQRNWAPPAEWRRFLLRPGP